MCSTNTVLLHPPDNHGGGTVRILHSWANWSTEWAPKATQLSEREDENPSPDILIPERSLWTTKCSLFDFRVRAPFVWPQNGGGWAVRDSGAVGRRGWRESRKRLPRLLDSHTESPVRAVLRVGILVSTRSGWKCRLWSQTQLSSVQFSRSVVSDSLRPHESQHARPPCPSPTPPEFTQTHVHWVGDAIQPSYPLLSPSPPSPNPTQHQGLFLSQLFTWSGQSIGVSASASVLPMNTQDWSPLGWTGWISLQSKGLTRRPNQTSQV